MNNLKTISGWGLYPKLKSYIYETNGQVDDFNKKNNDNPVTIRGNGRSYGDSSLGKTIFKTLKLNKIINMDSSQGHIVLQGGVLLDDIIQYIVPQGWFLPVTPGTKYITIGGAISSDIHGKNHHLVGCISKFISYFKILVPDQGELYCDKDTNTDLFKNTFGGMGLTGLILEVGLNLLKIQSSYIDQISIKTKNLEETFSIIEKNLDAEYCVCWLDSTAKNKNLGRSIVYLGKHSNDDNILIKNKKVININKKFIPKICSNYLFKNLNFLFYKKNIFRKKINKIYFDKFFYPLDKISNWNYFYGKNGFLQYQFCLPHQNSYDGILEILKTIQKSNNTSFTTVLKLMGDQNTNTLSFPIKGYTLALDFIRNKNIFELLDSLDKIVIKNRGRVYLTKDARLEKKSFIKMYENYTNFIEIRKKYNLLNKISSNQSIRLDI